MDKNDIIDYVMHTPHNTNKAVLSSMLNQLAEGSGGGGSSDFSIAQVTVTVTSGEAYINVPVAMPGDDYEDAQAQAIGIGMNGVYPVILYQGKCSATAVTTITGKWAVVAVTGNAEDMGDGNFYITGDCTVTVTLEDA